MKITVTNYSSQTSHFDYFFNVLFIRYEPFDFHKECSKMRWERLSILTDKLKANQDKFG